MEQTFRFASFLQQEFNVLCKKMINFVPENTVVFDLYISEQAGFSGIFETYLIHKKRNYQNELRYSLLFLAIWHYQQSQICKTESLMYYHINRFNFYNELNNGKETA